MAKSGKSKIEQNIQSMLGFKSVTPEENAKNYRDFLKKHKYCAETFDMNDELQRGRYLTLINNPSKLMYDAQKGGMISFSTAAWHEGHYYIYMQWIEKI